jgi:hypothetical protein
MVAFLQMNCHFMQFSRKLHLGYIFFSLGMQGIDMYLDASAKSSIGGWLYLFNSFTSGL